MGIEGWRGMAGGGGAYIRNLFCVNILMGLYLGGRGLYSDSYGKRLVWDQSSVACFVFSPHFIVFKYDSYVWRVIGGCSLLYMSFYLSRTYPQP